MLNGEEGASAPNRSVLATMLAELRRGVAQKSLPRTMSLGQERSRIPTP